MFNPEVQPDNKGHSFFMLPEYISVLYKWRMTFDAIGPTGKVYTDRIIKVNGDNLDTATLLLSKKLNQKQLELITLKEAVPFAVCHAFNRQTQHDVNRSVYKRFPLPKISLKQKGN